MLREVPMETIYEQIEHVRAQLLDEADTVVADACGKLEFETLTPTARDAYAQTPAAAVAGLAAGSAAALATVDRVDAEASAPLRQYYLRELRPFVEHPDTAHPLASRETARLQFDKVRALVPTELHGAITDLENICEEERQLMRQARMHALLHGWLLVHVPLSLALLALAVVHVVVALRY
jgi:hypothetical protein